MKNNSMRSKLLQSATALIDEGINWTWSLREISDDAGVASNEIFRRFKSRELFVEALCAEWLTELREILVKHRGIPQHLEHLRWIVSNRKRIIFLLAEAIQEKGTAAITEDLAVFLPSVEEIVSELKNMDELLGEQSISDAERATRVREAIEAGLGILLFAPSPYAEHAPDEGELLRRIWQQLWQIATRQDGGSAPEYF